MTRSRRRIAQLVAVGLVAFLATACIDVPPAPGNRVLVVGDSLVQLTSDELVPALHDADWDPAVQAVSGTTIEDWADRLAGIVAFTHPDVVVIELGTNDCVTACPDLAPVIDRAMRALADKPVLWLNAQDDTPSRKHADKVNAAINQAGKRWPNMAVVDMAARMHGHPEWRDADKLHFNHAGAVQLASLIVDALGSFAPASAAS